MEIIHIISNDEKKKLLARGVNFKIKASIVIYWLSDPTILSFYNSIDELANEHCKEGKIRIFICDIPDQNFTKFPTDADS